LDNYDNVYLIKVIEHSVYINGYIICG